MSKHEPEAWPLFDGHYEVHLVERLEEYLARSPDPDHEWLWCIYCERFFQAKFIQIDYLGNRQGCAFCGCAGFNVALHQWDTFKEGDPDWPESVNDLRHGLRLGEHRKG